MRTLLLGLMLVLASCGNNCPKLKYRDYVYGDRVEVVAGFYKGQWGNIRGRGSYYVKSCYVPHFIVDLDYNKDLGFSLSEVEIPQYDLFVHRKVD